MLPPPPPPHLRQCIALFAIAERWLLLDIGSSFYYLSFTCISTQNYLKLHGSVFYLSSVYLPNLKQILLRNERNIWVFILREDLRYVYISFKYKLFIALRKQKCSSWAHFYFLNILFNQINDSVLILISIHPSYKTSIAKISQTSSMHVVWLSINNYNLTHCTAPLHTLSKLYDVPVGFVTPPLSSSFGPMSYFICVRRRVLLLDIGWFVLFF